MAACPSCGQANPDGFRLCGMCGAPLSPTAPADVREERKVVSVLFCDLVGFTARSDQLDPEDVRAVLRPYHERVRTELERHGGTVEKFIGDAVMALFGAPVSHEDDPERAVRAALAIRDWAVAQDELRVRVAVTTGEALIRLGARPETGEGMASGDVVNTAARLQTAAPINGILVDESTYRATRGAIEFEPADAVEAKGKAAPIPVWTAASARSRLGMDVVHHARTGLVGREREMAILRDAFGRAAHERTTQLVTLVAVPGMGKSRLIYELSRIVDADPVLVTWRQGRCLAYGDGVAYWALAEAVKAEAGIDDRDDRGGRGGQAAHERRRASSADPTEAHWVEAQLRPLVGLETDTGLGNDRRGVAFAGWRRYLEALAERRPLVLVLEDLHWADDGLLDFVDELVDWLRGVPLLVVCSARPELLERRPGWGGGKLDATTIGLSALSTEQTSTLISAVLERTLLPAEVQQTLLERAEGNPLYAEQFAELYLERGSTRDLALPETLQGIVAARLDGLSPDEKTLLQDAAVVGKVFWVGALRRDEAGRDAAPPRTRAQGLPRPAATLIGRDRRRVGVRPHAPSGRRLRPDPASRACPEASRGGRVDRGPRAAGGPRRTARVPLAVRPRAHPRRRAGHDGPRGPGAPCVPGSGRSGRVGQCVSSGGRLLRGGSWPLAGARCRASGRPVRLCQRALPR